MAFKYMHPPRKDMVEVAIKNIMANLERAQGVPTANRAHLDAQHKMLEHYLKGRV